MGKNDDGDDDVEVHRAKTLKARINMLNGKTIYINIFADTESALRTKIHRIEDAVKALRFTLQHGYVPGAGVFYRNMFNSLNKENTFAQAFKELERQVYEIAGVEFKPELGAKTSNSGLVIDKKTYTGELKDDVIEHGIIDAARVVQSVITNSIAIAKEIASVGTYIETVKDDR